MTKLYWTPEAVQDREQIYDPLAGVRNPRKPSEIADDLPVIRNPA